MRSWMILALAVAFATPAYSEDGPVGNAAAHVNNVMDDLDSRLMNAPNMAPDAINGYHEFQEADYTYRAYGATLDYVEERAHIEKANIDITRAAAEAGQIEYNQWEMDRLNYAEQRVSGVARRASAMRLDLNMGLAMLDVIHLALEELGWYAQEIRGDVRDAERLQYQNEYLVQHVPMWAPTCWLSYWYFLDNGQATVQQLLSNTREIDMKFWYHSGGYLMNRPAWMIDYVLPGDNPLRELGELSRRSNDMLDEFADALQYDMYACFGATTDIF